MSARTARLRVFARLFTYQASWSLERLQGIGMAFCMEPFLRRLPGGKGGERYRHAIARAARYFNTHPYLAGLAVGAIGRAEVEGAPDERIDRLRTALKGPLGSIGDRLVWAGVLPLAVALGLIAAVRWHPIAGAVVFLVLFNAVHLPLRWWALATGWRVGVDVGRALQQPLLQSAAARLAPLALAALGIALPLVAQYVWRGFDPGARVGIVAVGAATFVVSQWIAPALGAARIGGIAVVVALALGMLWP